MVKRKLEKHIFHNTATIYLNFLHTVLTNKKILILKFKNVKGFILPLVLQNLCFSIYPVNYCVDLKIMNKFLCFDLILNKRNHKYATNLP